MARIDQGLMGPYTGKVGPVIGSSWKGIPYIKKVYKKRTGKPTQGETTNRSKFAMAQLWLKPVLDFSREGFKGYSHTVEGFIAAKSYVMLNAFEGFVPDLKINPALVKLSSGTLPLPENIRVEKLGGNELIFTWDASSVDDGNDKDQAMILAYDIEHAKAFYTVRGRFRKDGSDVLKLIAQDNRTCHIYFAFSADDHSRQSDTVYLAAITM